MGVVQPIGQTVPPPELRRTPGLGRDISVLTRTSLKHATRPDPQLPPARPVIRLGSGPIAVNYLLRPRRDAMARTVQVIDDRGHSLSGSGLLSAGPGTTNYAQVCSRRCRCGCNFCTCSYRCPDGSLCGFRAGQIRRVQFQLRGRRRRQRSLERCTGWSYQDKRTWDGQCFDVGHGGGWGVNGPHRDQQPDLCNRLCQRQLHHGPWERTLHVSPHGSLLYRPLRRRSAPVSKPPVSSGQNGSAGRTPLGMGVALFRRRRQRRARRLRNPRQICPGQSNIRHRSAPVSRNPMAVLTSSTPGWVRPAKSANDHATRK